VSSPSFVILAGAISFVIPTEVKLVLSARLRFFSCLSCKVRIPYSVERINRKEYQSLGGLWADVTLLCGNYRGYNEDGSTLFGDANLIEVSQ